MTKPTFEVLARSLHDADAELDVPEAHGLMSALACMGGDGTIAIVLGEVFGPRADAPDGAACRDLITDVWEGTCDALANSEFDFAPLLPNDDFDLAYRT